MSPAPGSEQAWVDALESALASQGALIAGLQAEIARLSAENAALRARLDENSRNSSKPPSSDSPFEKPAPKSLRAAGGRKPGGQDGHRGETLRQVESPDEVIVHDPGECSSCGRDVSGAPVCGVTRRQVFDIPPVTVRVVEHQFVSRRCACGTKSQALAPAGVSAPVQYGPRIAAIIVYLYAGQFLSKARTAQALASLFGTPVCAGTVSALTARAAGGLDEFLACVADRIAVSPVANFDETGLRVEGKLRWVHSASTGEYSLLTVHDKRGVLAMDAAGVLPRFTGVAVHDAWAPYDTYTQAAHALCNAHVLRELQAVADIHAAAGAAGWCWATQVADALMTMKTLADSAIADQAGLAGIDSEALSAAVHGYRSAARIGAAATAARSTKIEKKHNALARRLINREQDYLKFTNDPTVPFDNNAAEREIRMIKIREKVSGCLRTLTGAQQFAAIRSYLATTRKHDINNFCALTLLAEGQPWLPETA